MFFISFPKSGNVSMSWMDERINWLVKQPLCWQKVIMIDYNSVTKRSNPHVFALLNICRIFADI